MTRHPIGRSGLYIYYVNTCLNIILSVTSLTLGWIKLTTECLPILHDDVYQFVYTFMKSRKSSSMATFWKYHTVYFLFTECRSKNRNAYQVCPSPAYSSILRLCKQYHDCLSTPKWSAQNSKSDNSLFLVFPYPSFYTR